jgi:hypothetical protein
MDMKCHLQMDRYRIEAEPVAEPEEMNDTVLLKNGKCRLDEFRRFSLFHDVIISDL